MIDRKEDRAGWEMLDPPRATSTAKSFTKIEGEPVEPSIIIQEPSDRLLTDINRFFKTITKQLPADYVLTVTIRIENEWAVNFPLGRTFRGEQIDMDPDDLE